jgi:DNA-binding IclR family transcriptional regulator
MPLPGPPLASAGGTREPLVKSAARTLDILEELAVRGPTPLHALARQLGLPKSSLHALLRTMAARGWVETDPTGTEYGLGVQALIVGSSYVEGDPIVGRTAPVLDELAAATGETVHLARLDGSHVVYTAKRESEHPLRMFSAVGRRLPVHCTALGRAMLAELPDPTVRSLLPKVLEPVTAQTVTSTDRLLGVLADVRRDGYATEREESCLGLSCFAVSVPHTGSAQYAISVSAPLARLDGRAQTTIVEGLRAARARLERRT